MSLERRLRRLRCERGQSLVELLIAMTILSIAVTALVASFGGALVSLRHSAHEGTAVTLADRQMEVYRAMPYGCIPTALPATAPSGCESFSSFPDPYAASQTVAASQSPDHQSYTVTTTATSSGGVTQLTVTVSNGGSPATLTGGGSSETLATESSYFSADGTAQQLPTTPTASALVFTTSAASLTAGTTSGLITVERQTGSGTAVTSGTTNLTLSSSSSTGQFESTGGTAITSISIPDLSSSVSFYYTDTKAGSPTLTAADVAGVLSSATQSETVTPAAAVSLALTGYPTTTAAGVSNGFTVTAEDLFGNTATGYKGTVSFSATNDAHVVLPSSAKLTAGVGAFNATFETVAGGTKTLTATDAANSSITGSESGITVTPGAAASLRLTAATTSPTAGAADNLTITAFDAAGNAATGYTGSKTLIFSGASPMGSFKPTVTSTGGTAVGFGSGTMITFSNGVATVSGSSNGAMTLYQAGPATIGATDGTISTGSGLAVNVAPAAASQFAVAAPATATAGTAFGSVKLTAEDAYGNTATYSGSKTIVFSGPANSPSGATPTYPATVTFANAVGTASITLVDAQSTTLTASQQGTTISGTTATLTVKAGAPSNLAWTNISSSVTLPSPCDFTCTDSSFGNGHTFTASVSVTDADGNVVSNLGSGLTVAVTDNGTAKWSVAIPSTGTATSSATFKYSSPASGGFTDALATTGTPYATPTATFKK